MLDGERAGERLALMKCNVNPIDGSIRAALGLLLLATPILDFHTYPYNYLGLVLMLTAVVGYCPPLFGVRFCLIFGPADAQALGESRLKVRLKKRDMPLPCGRIGVGSNDG